MRFPPCRPRQPSRLHISLQLNLDDVPTKMSSSASQQEKQGDAALAESSSSSAADLDSRYYWQIQKALGKEINSEEDSAMALKRHGVTEVGAWCARCGVYDCEHQVSDTRRICRGKRKLGTHTEAYVVVHKASYIEEERKRPRGQLPRLPRPILANGDEGDPAGVVVGLVLSRACLVLVPQSSQTQNPTRLDRSGRAPKSCT